MSKSKEKKVKVSKYKSSSVGGGSKERHAKSQKTKNPTSHLLFVERKKQRNLDNYKKRANTLDYDESGKRKWLK